MEGYGRSWNVVEGHGRSWEVMEGRGRSWEVVGDDWDVERDHGRACEITGDRDLLQRLGCGRRETCDRQCAADIRVVMAATKAGQTSRGILMKYLHLVTAKPGFNAFAIH